MTKREREENKNSYYGHYFKDVKLLLTDYFSISNIDVQRTLYLEDEKMNNGCGCRFRKSLYPLILFDGHRNQFIPSRNKTFEEYGGGASHIIFLSLVDFSIRLLYEDCSTELCHFKETVGNRTLNLSSLIQSLPMEIFKKVIAYYCTNIRMHHFTFFKFVLKTSNDKCTISKLGYFKRLSFDSTNSERRFSIQFQFTEEQESYLLEFFEKIPDLNEKFKEFFSIQKKL